MKYSTRFTQKRLSPIPKKAKKVFQGVLYSVWQWEQKMYDGYYETFEMLKRVDSVGVIATDSKKRILIQEEKQPGRSFISLPGGRIDNPGIHPKNEATRELESETGYSSNKLKLWRVIAYSTKTDWQSYFFIAQSCFLKGKQNLDAGEKIKPKWISFDQFLKLGFDSRFRDNELKLDLIKAYYSKTERQKLERMFFK